MRRLPLPVAAVLVLTAGACATPPAEKSAAGERAGAAAKAGPGSRSGAGSDKAEEDRKARAKLPWWRLSQYSRKVDYRPKVHGAVRSGPGLLSGKEGGFVLFRKGEAGGSSDSGKPAKVRR